MGARTIEAAMTITANIECGAIGNSKVSMTRLSNHIYDGKIWLEEKRDAQQLLTGLCIKIDKPGYAGSGINMPKYV